MTSPRIIVATRPPRLTERRDSGVIWLDVCGFIISRGRRAA